MGKCKLSRGSPTGTVWCQLILSGAPWLLALLTVLVAPSLAIAQTTAELNAPRGPATSPRGCKTCSALVLGYYLPSLTTSTVAAKTTNRAPTYNQERYVAINTDVITTWVSGNTFTLARCCQLCTAQDGCTNWHQIPATHTTISKCRLLRSTLGVTATNWNLTLAPSVFGGQCNPLAGTSGDPHFQGADGTRFDFNGQLDRSFCLLSDRRIHINMGIKGYRPIANLPGYATSLDEATLAKALEAAANEVKPRHIRALEQDRLTDAEVAELKRMRENGSLPLTDEVTAALARETGKGQAVGTLRGGEGGTGGNGGEEAQQQEGLRYAPHELKAKLLTGKKIRSWIRELQVIWRDENGEEHEAFLKPRDGKQQERGRFGFVETLEIDGQQTPPPLEEGASVAAAGGFKLLLAESRNDDGKIEDEYHLTIDGVIDLGITARVAHPLMQTATEAQAHFNVHIDALNNTEAIHGVLGQTFRGEAQRVVRSLRYRLLTRLLREPVDVESDSGRGFLDGDVNDYVTSSVRAPDCAFAAAWRRGAHERSDGSDFV